MVKNCQANNHAKRGAFLLEGIRRAFVFYYRTHKVSYYMQWGVVLNATGSAVLHAAYYNLTQQGALPDATWNAFLYNVMYSST